MVLICYNSTQDCLDYKSIHNSICPKHYDSCTANVRHDEDCFFEFDETVQNDRAEFFSSYNDLCRINGVFDKFYSN